MSNMIWIERGGQRTDSMTLSNAVTGHLLAMLLLSGSALVTDIDEQDLIVFLGWHDQHWRGRGNVDVCLNTMPWRPGRFAEQRAFMERVIDGALARTGWQKVDGWTPQLDLYDGLLERFRTLLRQLDEADLAPIGEDDWAPPGDPVICARHGALAYDFSGDGTCLVCHI